MWLTIFNKKITIVTSFVLPALTFVASYMLFYHQLVYPDLFPADITEHLKIAEEGRGYSLLYFLMRAIIFLWRDGKNITIAFLESILTIAPIFVMGGVDPAQL